MKQPIRIVVVDDHALFRSGLVSLLGEMGDFKIVGEAGEGRTALEVIERTQPDVVLLDVNMPVMDGVETVQAIKKRFASRVLMLTISKQDEDLLGAITSGADGYLLKNAEPDELRKAILNVSAGYSVLSPEVTRQVLRVVSSGEGQAQANLLSSREMEVLACLSQGRTTAEIAGQLFISDNTVKTHVRHILEKLGASNRTEAVSKAAQLGLIGPES